MEPFGITACSIATVASAVLAKRAVKKKTLSKQGAVAGSIVGFLIVGTGLRGLVLFFFYQIGSSATKFKASIKMKHDGTIGSDGESKAVRGARQVLAVSITAVLLSLYHAIYFGKERPIQFFRTPSENESHQQDGDIRMSSSVTCAVIAHHATSLADTLASELGILSKQHPILITKPWKTVPPGTNGGITLLGSIWSVVGGAIIAILTMSMDILSGVGLPEQPMPLLLFGACCGLLGSIIDSVLGATVQATYYDPDTKLVYLADSVPLPKTAKCICGVNILTNEHVNFVSTLITTIVGGWILGPFIFGLFV